MRQTNGSVENDSDYEEEMNAINLLKQRAPQLREQQQREQEQREQQQQQLRGDDGDRGMMVTKRMELDRVDEESRNVESSAEKEMSEEDSLASSAVSW